MALVGTPENTHKTEAFLHDLAQLTRQYGIKFNGHLEPVSNPQGAYLLSTTDHTTAFISWCEGNKSEVATQEGGD